MKNNRKYLFCSLNGEEITIAIKNVRKRYRISQELMRMYGRYGKSVIVIETRSVVADEPAYR
jgi:hypothetical protein